MNKKVVATPYSDLIRVIGIKIKKIADARLTCLGLNSQQGQMIGYIYANQERGVIQKDLAEKFNRKSASITNMLQGLEKKGYIERIVPENNERQKNIYVLEKGINLVEEFNQIFSETEHRLTKSLTPEETKTLKDLLIKVSENL
ncbi:MarR family winged helix-turn-helix transcriptional regulator [Sporolactobacillus pectinivorans]|uniref:MarR family winged helix-turn-helix transcriptional regulator n=1 Tax=Sporolactobacillus pectinivorans TaxID=1591408 RepID=UPI000C261897|nr:MarR family transcriptional regulator [Sporolactobacillus pectinivorans]